MGVAAAVAAAAVVVVGAGVLVVGGVVVTPSASDTASAATSVRAPRSGPTVTSTSPINAATASTPTMVARSDRGSSTRATLGDDGSAWS